MQHVAQRLDGSALAQDLTIATSLPSLEFPFFVHMQKQLDAILAQQETHAEQSELDHLRQAAAAEAAWPRHTVWICGLMYCIVS